MKIEPQEVSDALLAFPADVMHLLPPMDEIPKEFDYRFSSKNQWVALVIHWFYNGLDGDLVSKDGFDARTAGRHIQTCIGSYQPQHEHKIAGCAYLLSLWFTGFQPGADANERNKAVAIPPLEAGGGVSLGDEKPT